jgi:hypothetical protein
MPSTQTINWLKFAALALLVAPGLLLALAAAPATAGIATLVFDLIFWPVDGLQSLANPETRLLAAVCGGVMAGWGVMIWLLAAEGFRADPPLARKAIVASGIIWFVIDTAGSFAAGAPFNLIGNLVLLLAFAAPLWRPLTPQHG